MAGLPSHGGRTSSADYFKSIGKFDDDRLNYLKSIAKTSIAQTRLSFSEALIGDKAKEHTKELGVAKEKLGDLNKEIVVCAKHDQLASVENSLGESADRLKIRQIACNAQQEVDARLESLEALIRQVWKVTEASKEKLGDLGKAVFDCAKRDQLASIGERTTSLEKFVGESLEHGRQEESMKIRLESLEALIGDNEDKHAKEFEAAKEKLGDLCKAIVDRAKHDQLASVEERMNSLEKALIESADKLHSSQTAHGKHEESTNIRLESLEALIGENADKHTNEIEAAKEVLGDFGKAILNGVKHDQLASVEKRMSSLEKTLDESAEKLASSQTAHGEHEESMKTRLDVLEALIEHNAGKYVKEIEASKLKLRDLDKSIIDCAKHDQLAIIEERINSLEKFFAESTAHGRQEESITIRLESLEALIAKEFEAVKEKLGDLGKAIVDCAKHDQLASFEARMNSLRKSLGESAAQLKNLQIAYGKHEESMEIHLEFLKALIRDNAEKYAKEIEVAKEKLGDLGIAISDCAKNDQLASFDERVNSLEGSLAESLGKLKSHQIHLSIDQRVESSSPCQIRSIFDPSPPESLSGESIAEVEQPEIAIRQDDEGHLRWRLDFGDFSPSKAFETLCFGLQGVSAPKDSKTIPGDSPTAIVDPDDELQSSHAAFMDSDALEWVPAHQIDSNSHIVGSWSYDRGTFCIHCKSSEPLEPLRWCFSQYDFIGELKATDDWLQVYIPCAKGAIRMQIDRTGNHLRVQFKRDGESRWRREVRAEREKETVVGNNDHPENAVQVDVEDETLTGLKESDQLEDFGETSQSPSALVIGSPSPASTLNPSVRAPSPCASRRPSRRGSDSPVSSRPPSRPGSGSQESSNRDRAPSPSSSRSPSRRGSASSPSSRPPSASDVHSSDTSTHSPSQLESSVLQLEHQAPGSVAMEFMEMQNSDEVEATEDGSHLALQSSLSQVDSQVNQDVEGEVSCSTILAKSGLADASDIKFVKEQFALDNESQDPALSTLFEETQISLSQAITNDMAEQISYETCQSSYDGQLSPQEMRKDSSDDFKSAEQKASHDYDSAELSTVAVEESSSKISEAPVAEEEKNESVADEQVSIPDKMDAEEGKITVTNDESVEREQVVAEIATDQDVSIQDDLTTSPSLGKA